MLKKTFFPSEKWPRLWTTSRSSAWEQEVREHTHHHSLILGTQTPGIGICEKHVAPLHMLVPHFWYTPPLS